MRRVYCAIDWRGLVDWRIGELRVAEHPFKIYLSDDLKSYRWIGIAQWGLAVLPVKANSKTEQGDNISEVIEEQD